MSARLSQPSSTSDDGAGGYYIADSGNFVIRRVFANGSITTVAGCYGFGYAGEWSLETCDLSICVRIGCFAGDGGPPTLARLTTPTAAILDNTGSLWISEVRPHSYVTATCRSLSCCFARITQIPPPPHPSPPPLPARLLYDSTGTTQSVVSCRLPNASRLPRRN